MTIEHKAFVFDCDGFNNELSDVLKNAILTHKSDNLIAFIERNLSCLKDPYEGETLDFSWKELIEAGDINEYGDFAITKYYDPKSDIGIGYGWEKINDALLQELNLDISPLLGRPFGSAENYFDPGKLGSYFQSLEQVKENFKLLDSLSEEQLKTLPNIAIVEKMLSDALALEKGLYITF
ncbi:hypothetical protein [Nostoc sp.]|uniref:hypothetical protein n=1 Tax=Nostoc sp. TaxID=1180 RepID=UPI002FFACFEF